MKDDTIYQALVEKIERLEQKVNDLESELEIARKPAIYSNQEDAVSDLKSKVAIGQKWLHLKTDKLYNSKTANYAVEPPFIMEVTSIDIVLRGNQFRKNKTVRGNVQMPKNMSEWALMLPDETIEQCLSRVADERKALLNDDRLKQPISEFVTIGDARRLAQHGIKTVADLLEYNHEQLTSISFIGHKTVKSIEQHLNKNGLYLGMLKTMPDT